MDAKIESIEKTYAVAKAGGVKMIILNNHESDFIWNGKIFN